MVNVPNNNEKAKIKITSLAHNFENFQSEVVFFPYDFEFDDNYKPEWGSYDAFGRMDPIMVYKRTTRDVTLTFNVVAEDSKTAKDNFDSLQVLINCLYPKYNNFESDITSLESALGSKQRELDAFKKVTKKEDPGFQAPVDRLLQEQQKIQNQIINTQQISNFGVQVIQKSPLFQISFMNLLKNDEFVAAITNFKHKLKFDAADTSLSADSEVIPGEFNISMTFKVLHTYVPGERLKLNYF
jgi:hypothetical protein